MHPQVRWIIGWQAALTLIIAAAAAVQGGTNAALSALAGGGIGVVANLLYVWRAMRLSVDEAGNTDAMRAYRGQAAGEAVKFAATLAGFALVFVGYKSVAPIPLFVGYASTFVIYWLALVRRR
ncbi:MAG TPA: ATP synthase subunit I [Azospira sp.]|nr:ATP synthase subunit I [Azospira sp.]